MVLFCPVCCSTIDATDADEEFTCGSCGQVFRMTVDPARIARYSVA